MHAVSARSIRVDAYAFSIGEHVRTQFAHELNNDHVISVEFVDLCHLRTCNPRVGCAFRSGPKRVA